MANNTSSLAEACHENQKAPTSHLITLLDQVAEKFPDHDAIISLHQNSLRWTFAQLQEKSIQLATRLSSRGVGLGSRIVTFMYNEAQWALIFWASARLGCQFVPLDPRVLDRDARDVLFLLDQLEPGAIFVSNEAMANRITHITTDHYHRPFVQCVVSDNEEINVSAGWTTVSNIMSEPLKDNPPLHQPGNPDDTILILFTSGTTALPKGCPHTTISIGAQGLGFMYELKLGPGTNLCQHLPNFHIFNIAFTLAFWLAGATVIFPSFSFDPQTTLQLIRSYQQVTAPCVPAMIHALLNCASPQNSSRPSFEVVLGGAPVTLDVVKRCRDLGATRVMIGYGMTEGIPFVNTSLEMSMDLTTRNVSVGKVFYGGRVRICLEGSRIPIHKEDIGEVHLGGLPVFRGYLGGSNDSCYREDGVNWIATGDQGYMDNEGYVYILGRYKDLIICGGENISPLKIEQCLAEVDGIGVSQQDLVLLSNAVLTQGVLTVR
jgi:acyl-CoA synthetase (AMP-forming)/AMP-acid ligase II